MENFTEEPLGLPFPPTMFFRIYPAALVLHWRESANSITRGSRNVVQTKVF